MTKELSYKSLKDYTNDELLYYIDNNSNIESDSLAVINSEILRRMNQENPLFQKKQQQENWDNPLTP